MSAIWKFQLNTIGGLVHVSMPRGSVILDCQVQDHLPTLWALVDPEAPVEERVFIVVGTGWTLGAEIRPEHHISTFQVGPFVWHVFEIRP